MTRKTGKAFEEEGQARALPSNKDLKGFIQELLKNKEAADDLRSDRKGIYDRAADQGIDRKALKEAFKIYAKPMGDDLRAEVNRILGACGQAPLFAFAEGVKDAA